MHRSAKPYAAASAAGDTSIASAVPDHSTRAPLASATLLGPRGEVKIEHNGELYSLRRTRQGKLILTK